MKLLRFNLHHEPRSMSRHGVLLDGDRVVDLRKAAARYLADVKGDIQGTEIAATRSSACWQNDSTSRSRNFEKTACWIQARAPPM